MHIKDFHAFTSGINQGILRRLLTPVTVISNSLTVQVPALWDTGATGTSISYDVAAKLKLVPTGMMTVKTASGSDDVNTYVVDIILPNNVAIKDVQVCDSKIGEQRIGMLIGMDIITMGDFSITNENGNTVFTFRIPTIQKIDYVKEAEMIKLAYGKKSLKKQKHR